MQTAATPTRTSLALGAISETLPGKAALALAASVFIAVCAHVSFRLPFTPVPLTLGDMAVVLVGLFLAPATAFAALVLYLAEGAAGLPVFNPGGLGGVAQLLGPTGGYLFAYPFAAAAASTLVRTLAPRIPRFAAATVAAAAASTLILTLGVLWLASLLHLAPVTAFTLGAAPFLPGQIVKTFVAAGLFSAIFRSRTNV